MAQDNLTRLKGSQDAEFVGRGIERIPERLEHAPAFLGEHLLGPNRFVQFVLLCFERLDLGCELRSDPAAGSVGISGGGGFPPGAGQKQRHGDGQEGKQDGGRKSFGGNAHRWKRDWFRRLWHCSMPSANRTSSGFGTGPASRNNAAQGAGRSSDSRDGETGGRTALSALRS